MSRFSLFLLFPNGPYNTPKTSDMLLKRWVHLTYSRGSLLISKQLLWQAQQLSGNSPPFVNLWRLRSRACQWRSRVSSNQNRNRRMEEEEEQEEEVCQRCWQQWKRQQWRWWKSKGNQDWRMHANLETLIELERRDQREGRKGHKRTDCSSIIPVPVSPMAIDYPSSSRIRGMDWGHQDLTHPERDTWASCASLPPQFSLVAIFNPPSCDNGHSDGCWLFIWGFLFHHHLCFSSMSLFLSNPNATLQLFPSSLLLSDLLLLRSCEVALM